jgi:endonuclease III
MQDINEIISLLKKEYPKAKTALHFKNPLQILIATILSAQCTDKRVNLVTKDLFKKYKTAKDFARAETAELENDVRSTGFYKNKAKFIKNASKLILEKFHGKVPKTMEELVTLPGVARKTANIVMYAGYGIISGIAIDTHCKRLSYRLGLTKSTDPNKIEKDLTAIVPKKDWGVITNLLIEHGREVCKAPIPICSRCILNKLCLKTGVKKYK